MGEVFNIRHETDLSEYTSTQTDSGDLSQSESAALAGSAGGLLCTIDDQNAIYGEKTFTELSNGAYRFRFYVDPNGLTMASADGFVCAWLLNGSSNRALIIFHYDGSNYDVFLRVYDDAVSTNDTAYYDISDSEHYIECRITYASSAEASDGTAELFIDGVSQEELTGLDLYDLSEPDKARLGACYGVDVGTSGTLYLDEFVLRDDATEIGPVSSSVAVPVISAGIHSRVFGGLIAR